IPLRHPQNLSGLSHSAVEPDLLGKSGFPGKPGPTSKDVLAALGGDGGALQQGAGNGRLAGDVDQFLPLVVVEGGAGVELAFDVGFAFFVLEQLQADFQVGEVPALACGIHAQGDGGAGAEADQQVIV